MSGGNCDGVMTWLSRLAPLNSRVSGCHVRLRQPSSAKDDVESLLDQVDVDVVGDASKLPCDGENAPALDELRVEEPNMGPLLLGPWGDWNGLPPDGTLSRRPGVREPAYMLWDREWDEPGDMTGPQRGLFWPVEKVADVGVLKSPGDGGR